MNNKNYTKIVVKVLDINTGKVRWKHLCYIEKDLYNKYMIEQGVSSNDMNALLARWCKEDFNVDLSMSSSNDLVLLREVVKDFYHRAHPDLYIASSFDRQGWFRVWITRKMKEDLKIYGE